MTFGLKNDCDLIGQILSFFSWPSNCKILGVDDDAQEYHGMCDNHIPFVGTDAADLAVFGWEAVEFVSCSNGLMERCGHVWAIFNYGIVVDKGCVKKRWRSLDERG